MVRFRHWISLFGESNEKRRHNLGYAQNPQDNDSKMLGLDGFFEYTTNHTPNLGVYSSPACVALDLTYDLIQQAPLLQIVWAGKGLALGKIWVVKHYQAQVFSVDGSSWLRKNHALWFRFDAEYGRQRSRARCQGHSPNTMFRRSPNEYILESVVPELPHVGAWINHWQLQFSH
jgi:hypothetical protein